MNKKDTMEILEEIRNQRNLELKTQGKTDISVIRVEALGKIENSDQEIYRLIEKQEFKDKPSINLEKFYIERDGKPELIAVKDPRVGEIVPVGIDGSESEKWEIYKESIEKSIEEREKELKAIAKELGMDEKDITSLSEIDLEQKIKEEKENADDEEKDEDELEQKDKDEKEKDIISKKKMDKIGLRNEVDVNVVIDERGKTLRDEIGLGEYTKIGVVHSYKLNELTNEKGEKETRENLKYGLVGQKPDGSYEKIPEDKIRMYRGGNTEITAVKNPQEIETKNDDCIFEIVGKNSRLSIRQEDPYGKPEVYYAKASRDNDGNMAEKLQDRYRGTEKTDVEVRELFNENKGIDNVKDMKDEARKHPTDEKKDIKEVDGNPNTGHIHFDSENNNQRNAIERIVKEGKIGEGSAKYYFIKKLEEMNSKEADYNPEKIADEIADEIIDELNEQVHPHSMNKH